MGRPLQQSSGGISGKQCDAQMQTMWPKDLQFMVDEIECRGAAGVRTMAKHRYGCRIFQRLLEHCRPPQVQKLVEVLLAEALPLSEHIYGHFVMQHIVEYGTDSQRDRLIVVLEEKASVVCS